MDDTGTDVVDDEGTVDVDDDDETGAVDVDVDDDDDDETGTDVDDDDVDAGTEVVNEIINGRDSGPVFVDPTATHSDALKHDTPSSTS